MLSDQQVEEFKELSRRELNDPKRNFASFGGFWKGFRSYFALCLKKKLALDCSYFNFPEGEEQVFKLKQFSLKEQLKKARASENIQVDQDGEKIIIKIPINFEDIKFNSSVDFSKLIFRGSVSFQNTKFQGTAGFKNTKFQGYADFKNTQFQEDAIFFNAKFQKSVFFSETQFQGKADFFDTEFQGYADFSQTKFQGKADFRNIQFQGNANFSETKFWGDADFLQTKFQGYIFLNNTEFQGSADFHDAKFQEDAYFKNIKFQGKASFYRTQFQRGTFFENVVLLEKSSIDFCRTHFQKRADFQLKEEKESDSPKVIFNGIEVDQLIQIKGNSESPKFVFSDNYFTKDRTVSLLGCDISKISIEKGDWYGFTFGGCKWPENRLVLFPARISCLPESKDNYQDLLKKFLFCGNEENKFLKEQYTSLKRAAENSRDQHLAAEFNFWQLFYSQEWNKPVNFLYLITCRYGLDYIFPFFWIILIAYLSFELYQFALGEIALIFIPAIKLSFGAATFGFNPFEAIEKAFENQRICNANQKLVWIIIPVVYFLQKSVSFFLWFEFGKAIRHRIKN